MDLTVRSPISILLVAGIALFCLALLFMAGPYWNITADSYSYLMGGKSLVENGRYSVDGKPLTVTPFVTSVLIGAVFLIFGKSFLAVNILMKILTVFCIVAAFFVLRQHGASRTAALIITLLTASNIHLLNEACKILSDIPFTLFSFLSIWSFTRYIRNDDKRAFLPAIFLMLTAYFTRTMGIALILAALTCLFIQAVRAGGEERKKKKGLFLTALICFAAPMLLWELRNALVRGETLFYIKVFMQKIAWVPERATAGEIALRTAREFIPFKLKAIGEILVNGWILVFPWPLALACATVYAGAIIEAFKEKSFLGVYMSFYLAIYILMDPHAGNRFLIPVIPFIFYYSWYFLKGAFRAFNIDIEKSALFRIALVFLVIIYITNACPAVERDIMYNHSPVFPGSMVKYASNFDEQGIDLWLKRYAGNDSVCMSERAEIDRFLSGKKFLRFPYTGDAGRMRGYIEQNKVDYIVIDKKSPQVKRFLAPVLTGDKEDFELMIDKRGASLYRVKR